MKSKRNLIIVTSILLASVFAIGDMQKIEQVSVQTSSVIDEQKIGWGIKRAENNMQPDLGSYNKQMIDMYSGISIGAEDSKQVYLTFDEGYEAGYTSQILDVLRENDVVATFFLTAHYINTEEDLVIQMIEEGHIIGNHTVNHKSMPDLDNQTIQEEIMNLHVVMQEKFEYEMKYFRPPMGEFSQRSLEKTTQLGYTTVMWSFAYEDWNENQQPKEEEAKVKILNNMHNGAVILLHGNSKTNADILGEVIKEIKAMGYEFKSLDEFER